MNVHSLARTTPGSRALLVQRVVSEKRSIQAAAEAFGVSRRTVYKWLERHRTGGREALRDRSSRPHRSPRRLELSRIELVVRLRRRWQTSPQIARGLNVACATVARALPQGGLAATKYVLPPSPPPA